MAPQADTDLYGGTGRCCHCYGNLREYLRGKSVILLVDAEAVEGALVKGYSAQTDVCELIGKFWDLALELDCSIYIDRVSTDANCADNPVKEQAADRGVAWLENDSG